MRVHYGVGAAMTAAAGAILSIAGTQRPDPTPSHVSIERASHVVADLTLDDVDLEPALVTPHALENVAQGAQGNVAQGAQGNVAQGALETIEASDAPRTTLVGRALCHLVDAALDAPEDDGRPDLVRPPEPPTLEELRQQAFEARVATRTRSASANRRAREVARGVALRAFARRDSVAAPARSTATRSAETGNGTTAAELPSVPASRAGTGVTTPGALALAASPEPSVAASGTLDGTATRSILFVWDASISADAARSSELVDFALAHGFTDLAIEATAVGYGDAAATADMSALANAARAQGVSCHALIGHPWFTVSAGAGLPGQMTSSDEGLAMIDAIVASGAFDGVVEDSHPYGVEYDPGSGTRNWLFDDTERATQDLLDYLDAAKVLLGDAELIKTTPFWYDSDARLVDVALEGDATVASVAHAVASGADVCLVLAYRDTLEGPNGILELVAGEAEIGPMVVAVETADLGPSLDVLTYHEEGHATCAADLAALSDRLASTSGFRGTSVHHYVPFEAMATLAQRTDVFGFIGTDRARIQGSAIVDSYDSRLGDYVDQVGYDPELDRSIAGPDAALLSNKRVQVRNEGIVHGDLRTRSLRRVRVDAGATVTGDVVELAEDIELPPTVATTVEGNERFRVRRQRSETLVGDHAFDRLILQRQSVLVVQGPATIQVNRLNLGRDATLLADVSRGPVTFVVSRSFQLRDRAFMAPSNGSPADLNVTFAGRTLRLRTGAGLNGDVLATNAHVVVDAQGQLYGRARARRLTLKDGAGAHLDRALLDLGL